MTADSPAVPDGLDPTEGAPREGDRQDAPNDGFTGAVPSRRRRRGRRGGQRERIPLDSSLHDGEANSSVGRGARAVSSASTDGASAPSPAQELPSREPADLPPGLRGDGSPAPDAPAVAFGTESDRSNAAADTDGASTVEHSRRRRRRGGRGRSRQAQDAVLSAGEGPRELLRESSGESPGESPGESDGGDLDAREGAPKELRADWIGNGATAAVDLPADVDSLAVAPGLQGSTRLASSRARSGGRRRDRGLTEEQKRMLRETTPDKRMVVTEAGERTQIAVVEGRSLVEHYVTRTTGRLLVGNMYLGRVHNVLPGMEAAFVDIGQGRNGVLYAGEVTYNEEDLEGEAPRIERALKPGQPVVVQVTKDSIGAKGPRLTTQISLAGRYVVMQPGVDTFGISRRLPDVERARLRAILKELRPPGTGIIVRTAAEGASPEDLAADIARLTSRWEQVEARRAHAGAPSLLYAEPELVVRVIRDIFTPDYAELIVDAPALYEQVVAYLGEVAPDLLPKVRRHDAPLPAFEHYHLTEQLHKALERKVWLPSGGSIVIDQTEAMTVVDVNTGRFVGSSNLEETVVAANLEAADEVVRQLRLRDIGGIIVVDFIDMLFEQNQQAVVDRLRTALARGKTKSQVMDVGPLGLVQMTRKRVSGGLLESFSDRCPTCAGRGIVINHEV